MGDLAGYYKLVIRRVTNDIALIAIDGAIDHATCGELAAMFRAKDAAGAKHLILNLEKLSALPSSSGLGILLGVADEVQQRGGLIVVVKPHPKLRHVVDMLRSHPSIKIARSTEAAVRMCGP